jgi:hypothetical protein
MPVLFYGVRRKPDGGREHSDLFLVGMYLAESSWHDGDEVGARDQSSDAQEAWNAKHDTSINPSLGELFIDDGMTRT